MMKKALSLLLAVLMAVSVFAGIQITAEAAYGNITWVSVTVTEPVVGASAKDTTVSVSAAHTNAVYFDQINYSDKDFNIYNGIQWRDVTAKKNLGYNDKFVAGHVYDVLVMIYSGPDFRFSNYPAKISQTVNGNTANGDYLSGTIYDNNQHYTVSYTFEALPDNTWIVDVSGTARYYQNGAIVKNKLVKDNGNWYYADQNGNMFKGWKKFGSNMRYFDYSTGVMATGLKKASNGNWYFFNSNGFRQYGLQKINGKWRYFDTSTGVMAKGWVKFGSNFRYFDKSTGVMATGLIKADNGNWYFFNGSGIRQYGWQKFGSNWRYFQSNGVMLANCTKQIDNYKCTFNANGIMTSRVAVVKKVYITKTGSKYHYDNHCNGGTYYETTLADAKSKGLTPCSKCVH